MNEVFTKLVNLEIDAARLESKDDVYENIINPKISIESLVDGFSEDDYKSAFFLLMDFVGTENFISVTNKDLPHLKAEFSKICECFKDEAILIELFGTLKMYQKLKLFDTCFHIYESKWKTFGKIKGIWKVLYMLCEEMNDENVKILKQKYVPENSRNYIQSAEDWFCWALNENIFSVTDLTHLETIFKGYPDCLNIIKSLKDFELYPMKVPSSSSHCGIALILNYENFNGKLIQRHNSDKDLAALKELWEMFGFEPKDYTDLNRSQTFDVMKKCALDDHSSFDAFVCCILSHGESDAVYSSDGYLMEISDLIRPVTNDCLSLENKPKLFFIQACQGTFIHQGVGKQVFTIEPVKPAEKLKPTSPPIKMDTLISYSSIDGYVSFRDEKGSWFIQVFCEIMKHHGDTYTIEEVLRITNDKISNAYSANFGPSGPTKALQMPEYRTSLRKTLIFKKCLE